MAEKKVIELEVKTNTDDIKGKFASLKSEISKTTDEVEQLSNAYGENSDEVKQATKELESLKTAYRDLNKVATDVGATFEDVYGDLQPLTTRMGEAEDRLYELTLAGKTNSKEYKDLLGVVGQYKRTMMETDLVVDAVSQTMASKLGGALNGAASAFSATEGAMALVGVESEDLQASMVRLQAAMALSQGLQGIKEAKSSFIALGSTAKNVFTSIKGAIGSTGIGLLVIAVGALVSNWKELTGWVEKSFPSFKKIGDFFKNFSQVASGTLDAVIAGFKSVAKVIGDVFRGDFSGAYEDAKKVGSNIASAYNKGFEEKDKEIKQNAFLKSRKFELDLLEAKGKDVADRQLRLMGAELKMLEKGSDEYNAKLIEIEEARTKIREEAEAKRKALAEKAEADRKAREEKALKKREDDLKWLEGFEDEISDNAKKRREKTTEDQRIAAAKELEIQSNKILEQAALDKQAAEDKKAFDDAELSRKKELESAKYDIVRNGLSSIGDLATAFAGKSEAQQKKAFEIQKAANIAGAVIDTIRATIAAFKSGNVVGGPILGGIQAGITAAAGATMIRNLEQQTFKGKGDTTAATPTTSGGGQANQIITPNFNIIGSQNQTQLAQLNQAPIKAYVVGSDVTTQQMLDKKKIQNATL